MQPSGVATLVAQLAGGELSPAEVVAEHLERIRSEDRALDAFVLVDGARALREARQLTAAVRHGRRPGPLYGVPFAVKDMIDVAGWPTRAHSRALSARPATVDSVVVARLRRAGAIPLGKLALQELGIGADEDATPWPPAQNPWAPGHTAGGSSSGAGAAVAAGLVPLAIGTDTGGSVRMPAALCGVVGLKPTYGRIDLGGVLPLAPSLDHVGWLTRSARDAELVLEALTGEGGSTPAAAVDLAGLSVGVVRHFFERDLVAGAETRAAIDAAVGVLAALGAEVRDAELRPAATYRACGATVLEFEAHAVHRRRRAGVADALGATVGALLERGALIERERYVAALRQRARLRAEAEELFRTRRLDVLVTGVTPEPAWRIGDIAAARRAGDGAQRIAFNLLGLPALALPVGFGGDGLPLAMQLVAPARHEAMLLRVGRAYQRATAWHRAAPPKRDEFDVLEQLGYS